MNQYLQILQRANAKSLNECVGLLIANGLNTVNQVNIIIETIGVYLRDKMIPRLKEVSIRAYIFNLAKALTMPIEIVEDCLQHLAEDGIIEFSEDRDYVVWKGPDPMPGLWKNAHLSSLNEIVMDAILNEIEKDKQDDGKQ